MNGVGEDSSDVDTIASSVESAVCDEVEEHFAADVAREIPESSEDDDLAQAPSTGSCWHTRGRKQRILLHVQRSEISRSEDLFA